MSPSNDQYIFAATDSGVFRSSDHGTNWTAANNGLGSSLIFSLAFKVQKTGGNPILFAGTGNGIYQSVDYGKTWTVTGSPSEWFFSSRSDNLFAVTSNALYYGLFEDYNNKYTINEFNNPEQTTLIHSTDNGDSWTTSFSGFLEDSSGISSLCTSQDNTGQIHRYILV